MGQEATVRIRHETTDWFKIGIGVQHGCILSPCLFNLYAVCVCMLVTQSCRNAGLDESQAGIKIARRNISVSNDADDTNLIAESEEKLKSLLLRAKEKSEKRWLKTQHYKN